MNNSSSLDEPLTNAEGDSDINRLNLIPDESAEEAYSEVEQTEIQRIIHAEVERLEERERYIIKAYYFENHSMADLAESLNISLARVHQLRRKALHNSRQSRALKGFFAEFQTHYEWNSYSRFKYSQQYFDLISTLKSREERGEPIRYGMKQAVLYSACRKYEQERSEALI